MGVFSNTLKKQPTTKPSSVGLFSDAIAKTVKPKTQPYYSGVSPKGVSLGFSDERDTTGRPFFAYRNPGDTSTTTDYRRVATEFDPRKPSLVTRDSFYNPRAVANKANLKAELGSDYNDELDHEIALALSGSNNPKNLRSIPASQNADSQKARELAQDVINGRKSLFQAQTDFAISKKVPLPFTGNRYGEYKLDAIKSEEEAKKLSSPFGLFKETIKGLIPTAIKGLEKTNEAVGEFLPGIKAVSEAQKTRSLKPIGEFAKKIGSQEHIAKLIGDRSLVYKDDRDQLRFDPIAAKQKENFAMGFIDPTSGSLRGKLGKEFKDLTLKTLEKLKGRSSVSKQFISDLTNSADIKQTERDLIRNILESEGDNVNVPKFAEKVRAELLPLKAKSPKPYEIEKGVVAEGGKYEHVVLPDEVRGSVKKYKENIYESPVKTSAGGIHFRDSQNYFGHTRIEDMADNQTRRVIEVQSDLYQKGNLEKERLNIHDLNRQEFEKGLTPKEITEIRKAYTINSDQSVPFGSIELKKAREAIDRLERKAYDVIKKPRQKEIDKLTQYNNPTAHFRMVREEIKKAAQDGKTKLQFPTGETAMKIEGLGVNNRFYHVVDGKAGSELAPFQLEKGKEIADYGENVEGRWIITDVLGDGKFKAVPKDKYDAIQRIQSNGQEMELAQQLSHGFEPKAALESYKESFDISGKVDINNPIYRFYEKDLQQYLKRFGGKQVVDENGVSWIEVPINKGMAKAPVEAFGAVAGIEQDEEGNFRFDPVKATLGIAGFTAFNRGKKLFTAEEKLQMRTQLEILRDVVESHPARSLSKFANKNGELPQVIGGVKGKFAKKGDDLVTELGFPDSETARRSYSDYLMGKKRLTELENDFKIARKQSLPEVKKASEVMPKPSVFQSIKNKLPKISEGEAMSLERAADQALSVADSGGNLGGKPLINMVNELKTPVKAKVNLLDYFRTPDRVLHKIGLGNEAIAIRRQYDAYLKELPKNIERISNWAKQLPKESSERIFKYLDNQPIDLRPEERKIALEIKNWLSEWADRLKLPKDKRISNYITHLFDDQIIAKEFDEDLAKIISTEIAGSVYNPFLLKRTGALGYKQDVWAALDAYIKRGTRKVHMDPVLERIKEKASRFEESQWNYVKKYTDRINLRPANVDNLLDNFIKTVFGYRFGQRPTTSLTRTLRQMTYRGMLGLNVGSALRNLSQGINTYSKLGEKYTMIGYAKLISPRNHAELVREGVLNTGFIQDRILSSTKRALQKADKGLFAFFDTAERINRGAAYFGAKAKGINNGMNEKQAIEYAKGIVRDTQFSFGSVDTPVALNSDLAKTIAQMQTFTVKQTEFLAEMVKNKEILGLIRYGLAGLSFVYTIGKAFGMEPKDLIPTFRLGVPPSLKVPSEIIKAALDSPDKYGNDRDVKQKLSDIAEAGIGLIPAGIQGKKTYQGLKAVEEGGSFDKAGRMQFPVGESTGQKIQAGIFGKYASPQAKEYFDKEPMTEEEKAEKKEASKPVFTNIELRMRELGVANGQRARFINNQLLRLPEEQQSDYINDLKKKRIINKTVEDQLNKLRQ